VPGGQQQFDISESPPTQLRIVSRQAHERKFHRWTIESLNHTKWECKYHVMFIPKRRKTIYVQLRHTKATLKNNCYNLFGRGWTV
jgi:hypothetical protein